MDVEAAWAGRGGRYTVTTEKAEPQMAGSYSLTCNSRNVQKHPMPCQR
jgi:hypothetical protein